jgi:hypothetical protein
MESTVADMESNSNATHVSRRASIMAGEFRSICIAVLITLTDSSRVTRNSRGACISTVTFAAIPTTTERKGKERKGKEKERTFFLQKNVKDDYASSNLNCAKSFQNKILITEKCSTFTWLGDILTSEISKVWCTRKRFTLNATQPIIKLIIKH